MESWSGIIGPEAAEDLQRSRPTGIRTLVGYTPQEDRRQVHDLEVQRWNRQVEEGSMPDAEQMSARTLVGISLYVNATGQHQYGT